MDSNKAFKTLLAVFVGATLLSFLWFVLDSSWGNIPFMRKAIVAPIIGLIVTGIFSVRYIIQKLTGG